MKTELCDKCGHVFLFNEKNYNNLDEGKMRFIILEENHLAIQIKCSECNEWTCVELFK